MLEDQAQGVVMRMRLNLSASLPLATTKQPLNNALRLTARVRVSSEISRLLFIAGTTLITDWANSQKVRNAQYNTRQQTIGADELRFA